MYPNEGANVRINRVVMKRWNLVRVEYTFLTISQNVCHRMMLKFMNCFFDFFKQNEKMFNQLEQSDKIFNQLEGLLSVAASVQRKT